MVSVRSTTSAQPPRFTKLVWEERGNRKVFVCPFHSWSFHNNGELRRITDEETFHPEVVAHRPGLTALACEDPCRHRLRQHG